MSRQAESNTIRALPPLVKVAMWAGGVLAAALLIHAGAWALGLDFDVFDASGAGRGLIIVLALAGLVMLMSAERRPVADYGLAIPSNWRAQFGLGLLAGIVTFGAKYAIAGGVGVIGFSRSVDAGRVGEAALKAIPSIPLAVVMTIIFSGYLLSMFRERHGRIVSCVVVAMLFAFLSRFEDAGSFLTESSVRVFVGMTLAGILLAQLRLLTGSVVAPAGLLAGWIAVRKFAKGIRLSDVQNESLAMWLSPDGDPRQAPALWILLGLCIIALALTLRERPEDARIQESEGVSESFKRFYPFANMGMFAPLDVWLAQLWAARFRIDPVYIPRTIAILVSAAVTFVTTLPERLLAPLLLRKAPLDPVFILGVHRSGTTHLQNLLSLDPSLACARTFQVINPCGFLTTGWILVPFLKAFSPWKRPMDAVAFGVFSPNEDEYAIANASGLSPDWAVRLPREIDRYERLTYPERMTDRERARWQREMSRFVRKLVAFRRHRRPLLKNPYNTARAAALQEIFPDARFVHIHRDPYRVYRSNMHLAREGHTLFQLQDPLPDRNYATEFLKNYHDMEAAFYRDVEAIPANRVVEVRFEDLDEDPKRVIRDLYDALELPYSTEFDKRLDAYLASVAGYRKNVFKPLDPSIVEQVNSAVGPLFARWNREMASATAPAEAELEAASR